MITASSNWHSRATAALAVAVSTLWAVVVLGCATRAYEAPESAVAARAAGDAPTGSETLQVPDHVPDESLDSPTNAVDGAAPPRDPAVQPAAPSDSASSGAAPGEDLEDPNDVLGPRVIYPPNRPKWIDEPDVREGPVHRIVVGSDPHVSAAECQRALDEHMQQVVDEYIDDYLDVKGASRLVACDLTTIRTRLVDPNYRYTGSVQFDFGSMRESYAMLVIDQSYRDELDQRWRQERGKSRLLQTGLLGGGALAVLALVFGFFSIDTATRGFYTGRLRAAVLVAILAVIVAGVLAARLVPWL